MSKSIVAPQLAGNTLGSADGSFVIAEWSDKGAPPGPPCYIAPLHLHHSDDEAWYVLEGTLWVKSGDDEVEVHAGSAVLVPRGTAHTYWNASTKPVRYLLIMTPNIARLIEEIHTMKDRNVTALAAVFEKYDSTLL